MNTEYEEFENIEDLFMYMSAAAPPMKNTIPINSYKGYICSIIPLSHSEKETYLMIYTKGTLENGILEFDMATKTYKKVESIERSDKTSHVISDRCMRCYGEQQWYGKNFLLSYLGEKSLNGKKILEIYERSINSEFSL